MRSIARRTLIGAAALVVGIVGLYRTSSDAADPAPVPEGEFKALFEQDNANIKPMIEMGKKAGNANKSKGSRGAKSNAIMIAYYANSRITGKNAAEDAKMATLRDTALKVAVTAGKKKFDEADAPAKALSLTIKTDPASKTKPLSADDIAKATDLDMEELMYQLKKTTVGGLGIEDQIKSLAKKGTMTPEKAAELSVRLNAIADFCDVMTPQKGFPRNSDKKDWETYNKGMRTAVKDVVAVAGAKDAKKVQAAFLKLDGACTACHEKFK